MSAGEGWYGFGARRVVSRSLRIWLRNLVPFTFLGVILYAPALIHAAFAIALHPGREPAYALRTGALFTLGWSLFWFLAPLSVMHGVLQQLRGEPVSIRGCLRVLLSRLLPALGVGAVTGIAAYSMTVAGGLVAGMLRSAGLPAPLAVAGISAAILYVYCIFWVAIPVIAVERPGVFASLGRSGDLTSGSRGAVFVISLVAIAVQVLPLVLYLAAFPRARGLAMTAVFLVLAIALGAYPAVAVTIGYHDLRLAKEGAGARDLARVFA